MFYNSIVALVMLLAGIFVFGYFKKRDGGWLVNAGYTFMLLALLLTMRASWNAILEGTGDGAVILTGLGVSALGAGLIIWGRRGEKAIGTSFGTFVYASIIIYLAFTLNNNTGIVIQAHAGDRIKQVVPEARREIINLSAEERQALAGQLAAALAHEDKYVRIGALVRLKRLPGEASAAVPYLPPVLLEADNSTLRYALDLVTDLGPAGAPLLPALKELKAGGVMNYPNSKLDRAISAVSVSTPTAP